MPSLNIIKNDKWLAPFTFVIANRLEKTKLKFNSIKQNNIKLSDSVNGHLFYGLHRKNDAWVIREWAPNATSVHIIGDFSNWKPLPEYSFTKLENGNWECNLPTEVFKHGDLYKFKVVSIALKSALTFLIFASSA